MTAPTIATAPGRPLAPGLLARRGFLTRTAATASALIAAPAIEFLVAVSPAAADADAAVVPAATADALLPFVDHYRTNVGADQSAATNAAVEILSGMSDLWSTGATWDTGRVLAPKVLRASMRHCAEITSRRTVEQAKQAFIHDRQDQSYGMIDGLGPLAPLYKAGALAVTTITSAPDGTPPTTVDDGVPPGAPAGAATGAGSPTSELGAVVTLVQTLRGNYSSGNPSKNTYLYPRPWRMTEDSTVSDTGALDAFGFPIYRSAVVVAPQLLRQRSTTPATDGGFPSGHTNAFFLAALAYAYAVPERYQELITRAFELADSRIVAGMHSPVDVIAGRILATALAAAILGDQANAATKAAARAQALAYFEKQTGATADTLFAYAHSAQGSDPYADRAANAERIEPFFTYGLPRLDHEGSRHRPMVVPKGAEVLLETRLPYATADQRREVLRTTALPSGHPLLDGPELWGRLNLFAAADGFGAFADDVRVVMDAAASGFQAADAWRNDISGCGSLTKAGTGVLTLSGDNAYTGGTRVEAGVLVAAGPRALGDGDVRASGGTLRLAAQESVRAGGCYVQESGVLEVAGGPGGSDGPALRVAGPAWLGENSTLTITLDPCRPARSGAEIRVLTSHGLHGTFRSVSTDAPGVRAEPRYSSTGVTVRLHSDR